MTLKDVQVYLKDTRVVRYGYKGVLDVLRRKRHVPYGKAYKMNRKGSANAEEILKRGFMNLSREQGAFRNAPPS